jgi:uncharacterized protein
MFARSFIDSIDFARNCRRLSGKIPLSALPRLSDLLVSNQGELEYSLHGLASKNGSPPMLVLVVDVECTLTCQRCLSEVIYPVHLHRQFALQEGANPFAVDDETDEYDVIEAETEMDVMALLEDELLLSLPYAAKHPEGECQPVIDVTKKLSSPFAVLEKLKR